MPHSRFEAVVGRYLTFGSGDATAAQQLRALSRSR
eukprot:CAMPEP_0118851192 /NCGR_PEP_ID=MMETSP1163-20130328/729_1 /TAXON_ID=124430 /ORGANISM="Phaeomonas parva, Strain CCMP2877" /LENGTH=34 /DNA_ID= /DNA_START= /DNA_END= /DNA_ORIENTATION=